MTEVQVFSSRLQTRKLNLRNIASESSKSEILTCHVDVSRIDCHSNSTGIAIILIKQSSTVILTLDADCPQLIGSNNRSGTYPKVSLLTVTSWENNIISNLTIVSSKDIGLKTYGICISTENRITYFLNDNLINLSFISLFQSF